MEIDDVENIQEILERIGLLPILKMEKYRLKWDLDGVKLMVDTHYLIPCLKEGLVIFIGEKEGYGYTVIVDQLDGVNVWYSNIDELAVSLYDYVDKGQLIGNCKGDYFYLVFKKDGKVLNYEEYI